MSNAQTLKDEICRSNKIDACLSMTLADVDAGASPNISLGDIFIRASEPLAVDPASYELLDANGQKIAGVKAYPGGKMLMTGTVTLQGLANLVKDDRVIYARSGMQQLKPA